MRPAGMVILPLEIKAADAPGLDSVRAIDALVLTVTDAGTKATVIDGVAAAAMVMVSA